MKAVRFHQYGGPEVLRVENIDAPLPGPGEVRIAVHASGVNPMGWRIRSGSMRNFVPLTLPAGVGVDGAGVVDLLGPGVSDVKVGDSVFGKGVNTAAEFAILSSWALMPKGLTFEEAAGFPVPYETAYRALREVGVRRGETLLLTAGAGGVGTAVLQLARDAGVRVVATASASKHDYIRSFGGIPVTYGPGLADRVAPLAPNGIAAALDLVGNGTVVDLIAVTGNPSKVLTLVDFDAPRHGAKTSFRMSADQGSILRDAAARYEAGRFRMPVQQCFPLDRIAEAHRLSQEGHVTGRLAVIVTP